MVWKLVLHQVLHQHLSCFEHWSTLEHVYDPATLQLPPVRHRPPGMRDNEQMRLAYLSLRSSICTIIII